MFRLAAAGDVHFGLGSAGSWRRDLEALEGDADILLIAGDLTAHGRVEEARILAEELDGLSIPVVTTLGNHDYHADEEAEIASVMTAHGVVVLDGASAAFELPGGTLGVAGEKGFGGGFIGASGSDFGEPEMKAFVRHTKALASRFEKLLLDLECDLRVALLHYSPIPETLVGERLEIYPFLGSYLLGEASDRGGADLVLHGHAHAGATRGATPKGVPVWNVAQAIHEESVVRIELPGPGGIPSSLSSY